MIGSYVLSSSKTHKAVASGRHLLVVISKTRPVPHICRYDRSPAQKKKKGHDSGWGTAIPLRPSQSIEILSGMLG